MEFLLTLRRRGIGDPGGAARHGRGAARAFRRGRIRRHAYADQALPIACGQTISQPYVVAYMTEQLGVRPHHRVLEVGTGSGYQAAVLSRLAREVVSIERYRTLAEQARERLAALGYDNVEVVVGDGFAGVPDKAPFDRIIVTAAAETVPQTLVDQLADDGIMVLPLGPHDGSQHIIKLTKSQTGLAPRGPDPGAFRAVACRGRRKNFEFGLFRGARRRSCDIFARLSGTRNRSANS